MESVCDPHSYSLPTVEPSARLPRALLGYDL
jgi:hypothetical protein